MNRVASTLLDILDHLMKCEVRRVGPALKDRWSSPKIGSSPSCVTPQPVTSSPVDKRALKIHQYITHICLTV